MPRAMVRRFRGWLARATALIACRSANCPAKPAGSKVNFLQEPHQGGALGHAQARRRLALQLCRRLLGFGYRVQPQVKVGPYAIDLVVEGYDDRRLAIELDGDAYHGPERWSEDLARQRVMERVGWRFWRCWGSSFLLDPDACMDDLLRALRSLSSTT